MADTDTQAPNTADAIARLYQQLMAQPAPALPTGTPDNGASPSWTGLLGRALSGGQAPGYQLRGGEADTSGNRALLNFGINTLLASGPHAVRPDLLSSVATGLQGAQESTSLDQSRAGALAAAQFQAQREGRQDQLARIKEAIPLLKLQQDQEAVARMRAASGGPTNTSIGAAGDGTYVGAIGGHEGTGQNPGSSAVGTGQFIRDTWLDFARANPQYFQGMSEKQILDSRTVPEFSKKVGPVAIEWLAKQNADALTNAGVPPAGPVLGIAHYVGAGAAANIAKAPDSTPVARFVGQAALDANPELRTMTVGQMKARYANTPNPSFMSAPAPGQASVPTPASLTPSAPGAKTQIPPPTGPRVDALPGPGTVQVAGPGAPTGTTAPTQMPMTGANVATIEEGMAGAKPGQGTMVAGPPGTVPPAMPPPPEFKMRPLTPTEQAQTSYALDPQVERTLKVEEAGALTPADMIKAQAARRAAITAQQGKADAARLAIESKAREDWQKQTSPATDAHLAAAGMMREPGVQYLVDNAGNVSTKEIPVDPRARQASMDENKRYQENYAGPYDKIRPVHQLLDQMEALDKKIKSDSFGGRGTVGSNFAQSVQKTLSGLGIASDGITDATANQEAYNTLHNQLVLKLKGLSGTSLGNMSNTDLSFLDNSGPGMNMTPEGRARTTAALRQILNYQGKLYDVATDVVHDPAGGYTLKDLNKKIAEVPPAIPTFPGRNATAADAKAWMEHNKPRRGTAYYNSKGDLAVWGVDPLE